VTSILSASPFSRKSAASTGGQSWWFFKRTTPAQSASGWIHLTDQRARGSQ